MKGLRRRRRRAVRDPRIITIALEGEQTGEEFEYFDRLRARLLSTHRFIVELLPTPSKTHHSAPRAVLARLDEYVRTHGLKAELDLLWLVFDIDTWREAMLSDVARQAAQKSYRLGISNPCFELWLLLHYADADLDFVEWPQLPSKRSREAKRLLARVRQRHREPLALTPSELRQATERAERLLQSTPPGQRWPSFPGTHVHGIINDLDAARLLPTG